MMKKRGAIEKLGFYTVRIIQASSESEAELKAVEMVSSDKELMNQTTNDSDDAPRIIVEEINLIEHDSSQIDLGYAFYNED